MFSHCRAAPIQFNLVKSSIRKGLTAQQLPVPNVPGGKTWTRLVIQQIQMTLMITAFGRDYAKDPFGRFVQLCVVINLFFVLFDWCDTATTLHLSITAENINVPIGFCWCILLTLLLWYFELFFSPSAFATRRKSKKKKERLCPLLHVTPGCNTGKIVLCFEFRNLLTSRGRRLMAMTQGEGEAQMQTSNLLR